MGIKMSSELMREDAEKRGRKGVRKQGKPDLPTPRDRRRPESEPRNLLTGGQAKLDKNKNNKLDAQDFKILRAEKAKGRGMGLQDEKVKPGKVMKAKRGMISNRSLPTMTTAPGSMASKAEAMKKMKSAKGMKRKALQRALKAAKATRIGKIAGAVAAVGLGAKAYLDKKAKKKVEGKMGGGMIKKYSKGMDYQDVIRAAARDKAKVGEGKKFRAKTFEDKGRLIPDTPRNRKRYNRMGGGMMMRPMGYKTGKMIMARGCKLGRKKATKIT